MARANGVAETARALRLNPRKLAKLAEGGAESAPRSVVERSGFVELARIARVEQQTMAELLARMERDRLVERVQNPDDKRGSLISLSRSARLRFPKAAEALLEGERRATAGFTAEEKVLFVSFLQRVLKNLED